MLVLICSDFNIGIESAKKLYEEHNILSCAVETEYNVGELNEEYTGIGLALNHHKKSGIQPSLVYKENFKNYSSFIISHIDADTIFGIAWVSGLFYRGNKKLEALSEIVAEIDRVGLQNANIPEELKKEATIVSSIASEAKNKLSELKYKKKYVVTNIVKKAIIKIRNHIQNPVLLNKKYNMIMKNHKTLEPDEKLSNNKVHVFRSRKNNFLQDKHKFIINYNRGISIFGRNDKITSVYFPKGLPYFLNTFFKGSGGHFSSAGTKRNTKIPEEKFLEFLEVFKNKIDSTDKANYILIEGEL